MTGVLPNPVDGGKVIRDATKACFAPTGVSNIYCPPATFSTTCDVTSLPNDCTARITPAQINAIVSELLAFTVALTPNGAWNCASVTNLATAFTTWKSDFGHADQVTIGGLGTVADPYHVIVTGLAAAICADAEGITALAACLISTDPGNGLLLGADGKLFGAGTSTDTTIDGVGSPTDPFRVNLTGLIAALCANNGAGDALAACLISTDLSNGLSLGTDGRLTAQKISFYNGKVLAGSPNSWVGAATPKMTSSGLEAGSIIVGIVPAANTAMAVTMTLDGVSKLVRLADGVTPPPIGYFQANHEYMFRNDQVNGTWATILDMTALGSDAPITYANAIYGAGVPASTTGATGEYYYDVSANTWYGPKVAGTWTANSLIGSDYYNLQMLGGTATAYTASSPRPDMADTGPRDGSIAGFTIPLTNTGTNPTLTVSGGAARGMRRGDGSSILANDLIANHMILAFYDATTNLWRCSMDLTTGKAVGSGGVYLPNPGDIGSYVVAPVFGIAESVVGTTVSGATLNGYVGGGTTYTGTWRIMSSATDYWATSQSPTFDGSTFNHEVLFLRIA